MKIIQTTLIVFFCFYCSPLIAKDYLGIYTTRPYLFLSFSEPYPEEIEKIINNLTWELEINESEMLLRMDQNEEAKVMLYTKEGNILLVKEEISGISKYIPFYIDERSRIHGLSTIFFRKDKKSD